MDSYSLEVEEWRKSADQNLRNENSWLALAGLYWLDEGETSFGMDPSNGIVLPPGSGAERLGVFDLKGDQVTLYLEKDIDLKVDGKFVKETLLKPDVSGSPSELTYEALTFILIERDGSLGIRLWDNQRSERKDFTGRVWFPIDKRHLVKGAYEPFEEELELVLQRKNASDVQDLAQGQIMFQMDGLDLSLLAFEQEDGSLFTLFSDQTSGKESYPAGRYLMVDPPQEGSVEIDFNRAFNPPCAVTDFATCPLPPAQNKLNVAILAGERI